MITPTIMAVRFNGEMTDEADLSGGILSSEVNYRFYEKSARKIPKDRGLSGIRKEYQHILDVMGKKADVFQVLKAVRG